MSHDYTFKLKFKMTGVSKQELQVLGIFPKHLEDHSSKLKKKHSEIDW